MFCIIVFTAEYVLRLCTCHTLRSEIISRDYLVDMVVGDVPIAFKSRMGRLTEFFFQPANMVDFFAILPFYLEFILDGLVRGFFVYLIWEGVCV